MKLNKLLRATVSGVLLSVLLTGCGIATQNYSMSLENSSKLKLLSKRSNNKVNVGAITSSTGKSFERCRITDTIETPSGKKYEEYLKEAIDAEFIMADLHDLEGVKLTGDIKKLDLDASVMNASWKIEIEFIIGENTFTINHSKMFEGALNSDVVCPRAAKNFDDLIQGVVGALATNPQFLKSLK